MVPLGAALSIRMANSRRRGLTAGRSDDVGQDGDPRDTDPERRSRSPRKRSDDGSRGGWRDGQKVAYITNAYGDADQRLLVLGVRREPAGVPRRAAIAPATERCHRRSARLNRRPGGHVLLRQLQRCHGHGDARGRSRFCSSCCALTGWLIRWPWTSSQPNGAQARAAGPRSRPPRRSRAGRDCAEIDDRADDHLVVGCARGSERSDWSIFSRWTGRRLM